MVCKIYFCSQNCGEEEGEQEVGDGLGVCLPNLQIV